MRAGELPGLVAQASDTSTQTEAGRAGVQGEIQPLNEPRSYVLHYETVLAAQKKGERNLYYNLQILFALKSIMSPRNTQFFF